MFARPVPGAANRLNAWVTAVTCQWLMGPSKVNDVELPDGQVLPKQGVLVERCFILNLWARSSRCDATVTVTKCPMSKHTCVQYQIPARCVQSQSADLKDGNQGSVSY